MSAREPSGSGALAGSPASMHGEPGSSRKSATEAEAKSGSALMFPVPGVNTSTSLQVVLEAWSECAAGWLPQTMQFRSVEPDAAEPLVVPCIEFSTSVQRSSTQPMTAPPPSAPAAAFSELRQKIERSTVPGPEIAPPPATATVDAARFRTKIESRTVNGLEEKIAPPRLAMLSAKRQRSITPVELGPRNAIAP